MIRKTFFITFIAWLASSVVGFAQVKNFAPVTRQMLENPSPNDWLMFSWTYDAQRFSPLGQIKTGKTKINWDLVFKQSGERKVICYWNTRSYWPTAYSPTTNSIYTSYIDNCRDLTLAGPQGRGTWNVIPRPGSVSTITPRGHNAILRFCFAVGEALRRQLIAN